jgi:hypothetical protein
LPGSVYQAEHGFEDAAELLATAEQLADEDDVETQGRLAANQVSGYSRRTGDFSPALSACARGPEGSCEGLTRRTFRATLCFTAGGSPGRLQPLGGRSFAALREAADL